MDRLRSDFCLAGRDSLGLRISVSLSTATLHGDWGHGVALAHVSRWPPTERFVRTRLDHGGVGTQDGGRDGIPVGLQCRDRRFRRLVYPLGVVRPLQRPRAWGLRGNGACCTRRSPAFPHVTCTGTIRGWLRVMRSRSFWGVRCMYVRVRSMRGVPRHVSIMCLVLVLTPPLLFSLCVSYARHCLLFFFFCVVVYIVSSWSLSPTPPSSGCSSSSLSTSASRRRSSFPFSALYCATCTTPRPSWISTCALRRCAALRR